MIQIFGSNFYNLEYTGTVLEVNGDDVSINNSILENGRTVIRSYSSNLNILIMNSHKYKICSSMLLQIKSNLKK